MPLCVLELTYSAKYKEKEAYQNWLLCLCQRSRGRKDSCPNAIHI